MQALRLSPIHTSVFATSCTLRLDGRVGIRPCSTTPENKDNGLVRNLWCPGIIALQEGLKTYTVHHYEELTPYVSMYLSACLAVLPTFLTELCPTASTVRTGTQVKKKKCKTKYEVEPRTLLGEGDSGSNTTIDVKNTNK